MLKWLTSVTLIGILTIMITIVGYLTLIYEQDICHAQLS